MSEPKSTLPANWASCTLELCCSKLTDGAHFSPKYVEAGYPFVTISDVRAGEINFDSAGLITKHDFEALKSNCNPHKGDILFSKDGTVGKVVEIDFDKEFIVLSSLAILRPHPEFITSKYLKFLLQSNMVLNQCTSLKSGTALTRIILRNLRTVKVPVPPVNEQIRIAGKVEELFSLLDVGVASLQKVQAQLKRYRQAVLKYAFEGKLTEEWRRTHEIRIERSLLKNSHQSIVEKRASTGKRTYENLPPATLDELPLIPTNWIWVKFEEVIYVIDYRGRTPPFSSEGIPHLRSSNIRNGKIVWEDLRYISEKEYQKYMVRGLPEKTDLLFTTEAPLGEVAFVPNEKFSIAQRVIILRPNKNWLNPKFLFYQIMSKVFQERLFGKGTGTTVTGISYRNLRQVDLVTPPLEEQELIVSRIEALLSILDETEKVVSQNLIQVKRLRQSILMKAFNGKLIPQDPADEPAEKLLERIKQEKEKLKEKGIQRKKSNSKQLELSTYVK